MTFSCTPWQTTVSKALGDTPTFVHGRNVSLQWPPFGGFSIWWGPYFTQSDWPPLAAEQIYLSLTHLVPEILGPKIGLIFHHNVLFNRFKAFYINFALIFYAIDLFFIDFKSFWPLIFNLRSNWVNVFHMLKLGTENLMKYSWGGGNMVFQVYGSCIHFQCPGTVSVF